MHKKDNAWFNWHCPHCQHRNRVPIAEQLELPRYYETKWTCDNCGKKSMIEFDFAVHGYWKTKKAPKMRKRRKEEKKRRKKAEAEYDSDTQKDSGYRNDSAKQKV